MLADCLPLNRRLVFPHCPACTAPRPFAAWFGIGALVSRTWHCPYCGTPRSWRVPLIEVVTVMGVLCLYQRDPTPISFGLDGLVLGFFLLIVVIDVEHRLILHVITGPAALIFSLIGVLKPDFPGTRPGGAGPFWSPSPKPVTLREKMLQSTPPRSGFLERRVASRARPSGRWDDVRRAMEEGK